MAPSDTTNTAPALTGLEAVWADIEAMEAKLEDSVVAKVNALESEWDSTVWPYVKKNLLTLLTDVGKAALGAAVTAIPTMISGGWAAAAALVGSAVASTAVKDINADAPGTMQTVQAALQVVKSASNTVTDGDAPTVAAIQVASTQAAGDNATA